MVNWPEDGQLIIIFFQIKKKIQTAHKLQINSMKHARPQMMLLFQQASVCS